MLSYLCYNYYLCMKEDIKSRFKNEKFEINDHFNKIADYSYYYTNKYMNWKHNLKTNLNIEKINKLNKLLLISNHSNLSDFVHILYIMRTLFPEHKIMGVTLKMFVKIKVPYITEELENHHILLEGNYENDKLFIEKQLEKFKNEKIIILLFPEGTIYNNREIRKSIEWCKKNNLKLFKETLCPRSKGLYTILDIFKPDYVIQALMTYKDDPERIKGNEFIHILENNFPLLCDVELYKSDVIDVFKKSKDMDDFTNLFYNYWYDIDDKIIKRYIKIRKLHEIIKNNKQLFYDYTHDTNKMLLTLYNYMVLIIPLIYYKYGFKVASIISIIVFIIYKYYN